MPCRATTPLLLPSLLLAACAGPAADQRFDPGQPNQAQLQALKQAEVAYRDSTEDFPAQRDALARDPITAAWLTRMLVRDVVLVRESRDTGRDAQLLRAAAGVRDPIEVRATSHLQALGGAAATTLVEDLIRHPHGDKRELGVELLGAVGTPALPALEPAIHGGDDRTRRAAVRAVAAMEFTPATARVLNAAAGAADFGVRGEAMRGLGGGGAAELATLRRAVAEDSDPFVRRTAAQALGGFRDRDAAASLIDYLARCKRDREHAGEQAAQVALQAQSGGRGPRTVEAWRAWLQTWDPLAPLQPR